MELLTIKDVARLLKVSEVTVRRLQQARQIPFLKIGGGIRFTVSDVEKYLKQARVEAVR